MPNNVVYNFIASDKFSAAGRRISSTMGRINKKFALMGPAARVASQITVRSLAAVKGAAISTLRTGMAPLLAAFAGFAGAVKFFTLGTNFQDSLADLSAITGATGRDLAFLSEESLRLGQTARTASSEVATGFKLVASAKSELLKDPKALSQITEQVLLLRNATGTELASSADVALTAMNQFAAGADQAGRFVNVLAAGSKIGASEVFDTGEAIRKSGVAARLTGVGFEELNAAIQVLAKNGEKGQLAGTGLKGVLIKLDAQANRRLRPSVVGLNQALDNLAAMNLDNAKLTKLFGLESLRAAGILISNASLVRQWTSDLTGTSVAVDQAAIRMATFSSRMKGVSVIVSNFLIRTFNELGPEMDQQIGKFERFSGALDNENVKGFASFLRDILGILASMTKLVVSLARLGAPLLSLGALSIKLIAGVVSGLVNKIEQLFNLPFTIFDKARGLFGEDELRVTGSGVLNQSSRTDVNVQLAGPKGAIESIKTKTTGVVTGLNVGVNMKEAL